MMLPPQTKAQGSELSRVPGSRSRLCGSEDVAAEFTGTTARKALVGRRSVGNQQNWALWSRQLPLGRCRGCREDRDGRRGPTRPRRRGWKPTTPCPRDCPQGSVTKPRGAGLGSRVGRSHGAWEGAGNKETSAARPPGNVDAATRAETCAREPFRDGPAATEDTAPGQVWRAAQI